MKKLKYGTTPLDGLSHKKLLLLAKKMFCTLTSARSVLAMMADVRTDPYWTHPDGSGRRALCMANETMKEASHGYEAEDIYRSYFRLAVDPLFKVSTVKTGWLKCTKCKDIVARANGPNALHPGSSCADLRNKGCKGLLRALRLSDIKEEK